MIAIAFTKNLPTKEESYGLIENCHQSLKEAVDLLEVAIPKLIEADKHEELYTLLKISFSDIRGSLDGIDAGMSYLKRDLQ